MNKEEVMMRRLLVVAMVMVAASTCGGVFAQSYPTKPVKLIVTYPPGGAPT